MYTYLKANGVAHGALMSGFIFSAMPYYMNTVAESGSMFSGTNDEVHNALYARTQLAAGYVQRTQNLKETARQLTARRQNAWETARAIDNIFAFTTEMLGGSAVELIVGERNVVDRRAVDSSPTPRRCLSRGARCEGC